MNETVELIIQIIPWLLTGLFGYLNYKTMKENILLEKTRLENEKSIAFRDKSLSAYSELYGNATDIASIINHIQDHMEHTHSLTQFLDSHRHLFRKYSFFVSPLHRNYFQIIFMWATSLLKKEIDPQYDPLNKISFETGEKKISEAYVLLTRAVDEVMYPEEIEELRSDDHQETIADLRGFDEQTEGADNKID